MLIIGLVCADSCAVEPWIPRWMWASGVIGTVRVFFMPVLLCAGFCCCTYRHALSVSCLRVILLLSLVEKVFLFIWFCLGCYWTFHAFGVMQHDDASKENYCHGDVFRFAFASILLGKNNVGGEQFLYAVLFTVLIAFTFIIICGCFAFFCRCLSCCIEPLVEDED